MRWLQYLGVVSVLASCNIAQERNKDSITSGSLKLGSDLSYTILTGAETFAYTHLNPYSKIETLTPPNQNCFSYCLNPDYALEKMFYLLTYNF
jgi:hypothetical protein